MLLFLFTVVSVDIILVSYGDPLKSYRYHRKSNRNYHYKRRNDYNYNDWEEKKEDYYQLLLSTTNVTKKTTYFTHPFSSSFSISSSHTSTLTIPSTSKITSPTTEVTFPTNEVTFPTTEVTFPTTEVTSPTTKVTSPTIEVTSPLTTTQLSSLETISSQSTSTTSTVVITTLTATAEVTTIASTSRETSSVLDITTDKIFENFTIQPTATLPVINHIVYEINKIKKERREGGFTASLIMLLQVFNDKESGHLSKLLNGIYSEVTRLNSNHQLTLFGPIITDRVTSAAMAAAYADVEQVRAQLRFVYYSLHNRRSGGIPQALNSVIDVTDNIYNENDVKNVADAIRDFQIYPSIDKKPEEIAKELAEAFVFTPFKRIQGTTKERLLLMEIDYTVDKLLKAESEMRRKFGGYKSLRTTYPTKTTKSIMDMIIESNYVTNKTVMEKVKQRMNKYKYKKRKDKKKKLSRGISTKSAIITKKVKMHKSKYYIRKYVKKTLHKMTTTTAKSTTTRDRFKYYGKIREKKEERRRYIKSQSYIDDSDDDYYYSDDHDDDYNDDDYYYSDDHDDDYNDDDYVSSRTKYKKPPVKAVSYNFRKENIKKTDFSDYDEETKLKLHLRDALIHTDHINNDYRKVLQQKINKNNEDISDELILKRNIYSVFGYT